MLSEKDKMLGELIRGWLTFLVMALAIQAKLFEHTKKEHYEKEKLMGNCEYCQKANRNFLLLAFLSLLFLGLLFLFIKMEWG